MKTLFIVLFLVLFFIVTIPLCFVEFIIGKFNPRLRARNAQAIIVFCFNVILVVCGVKKTVIGKERIPKDQAVLYVANHRSYFDILVSFTSVPNLMGFVAKKEMDSIPFLRTWMRFINCLFLNRKDLKEGLKTILQGIELVKDGYSIFIAPEGTRNSNEEMLPFKEGSLKIAEKSGCPIIPVSFSNTDSLFEKHLPWVTKGHVVIEFGEPIYPKDLPKEDRKFLGVYVQKIIKDTLEKNKALIK